VLRGENSWSDGNIREGCEDLRIERSKWEVFATGKFDKQGVIHRNTRLNRPFKGAVPQRFARDGLNPELGREAEALSAFIGQKDFASYGHPNDIRQLRLPNRGRQGTVESVPEAARLFDEWTRAQEEIREDVRIDDRSHSRPVAIHPSTSAAVGRRACLLQAASTWSRTERRSPTCSLMSSRTSCSIERWFFRARDFNDFATLSGTFRIVRVAMDSHASTMLASRKPANKPLKRSARRSADKGLQVAAQLETREEDPDRRAGVEADAAVIAIGHAWPGVTLAVDRTVSYFFTLPGSDVAAEQAVATRKESRDYEEV
jgi:hypothetical protein